MPPVSDCAHAAQGRITTEHTTTRRARECRLISSSFGACETASHARYGDGVRKPATPLSSGALSDIPYLDPLGSRSPNRVAPVERRLLPARSIVERTPKRALYEDSHQKLNCAPILIKRPPMI